MAMGPRRPPVLPPGFWGGWKHRCCGAAAAMICIRRGSVFQGWRRGMFGMCAHPKIKPC